MLSRMKPKSKPQSPAKGGKSLRFGKTSRIGDTSHIGETSASDEAKEYEAFEQHQMDTMRRIAGGSTDKKDIETFNNMMRNKQSRGRARELAEEYESKPATQAMAKILGTAILRSIPRPTAQSLALASTPSSASSSRSGSSTSR